MWDVQATIVLVISEALGLMPLNLNTHIEKIRIKPCLIASEVCIAWLGNYSVKGDVCLWSHYLMENIHNALSLIENEKLPGRKRRR